jgi:NADH:ubiquinone oxidoreductase subunit 6 (subunit J)
MMTRRLMQTTEDPFNSQRWMGLFGAVAGFVLVGLVIGRYWPVQPSEDSLLASRPYVDPEILRGSVARLGVSFVSADAYVIPFEIASVLLLAALVGAIVVAWPKAEDL